MNADTLSEYFDDLRAREFSRLDKAGQVYLDYTGSGLYAESQLRRHQDFLARRVLGNPHSENPASSASTRLVDQARREVLDFFNADPAEYVVIFTANASHSLKLVGESFPFVDGSRFVLVEDNHNSVNGIREFAEARGAEVTYLDVDRELRLAPDWDIPTAPDTPSLFAYPAQSNFSGVQHPLSLVEEARSRGYRVVLDVAAFVPTNRLDLGAVSPDFACVSFYKMFGFPTGVGALIARRHALAELVRPWFAGGTVEFVSVQNQMYRLNVGAEGFEDGTPNFLGIAALPGGLGLLREVGIDRLHERVMALTARMIEIITGLRHGDGRPVVDVYGPVSTEMRGATVAFNLRDARGRVISYALVEHEASEVGISLRGGCFCNPGAAEVALHLPAQEARQCFESFPRGAFNLEALADCFEEDVPVGALRASLGIATNAADLDRFADFLGGFRDRVVESG